MVEVFDQVIGGRILILAMFTNTVIKKRGAWC
jgi:hypothetical protein